MMRRTFCFILGCAAMTARASDEGIMTVLQPLETSGAGNIVSAVTYIGYTLEWQNPASELLFTVQPNLIWCDGKAKDRNSAVAAGINFKLMNDPPPTGGATQSDTLHVTVDLSTFAQGGRHPDEYDQHLLTSTLWCGLRNARQRWPKVRFVQYSVEGQTALSHYSGVYPLERVAPPEQPHQWFDAGPDKLRK